MYLDLIQNAALLVALSTAYSLIVRLRPRIRSQAKFYMGLLFGGVAVAGMMMPVTYAPGIIYDGRSVILTMAGLFGGGVCAALSMALAGAYRAYLGGAGVWAGLATIVACPLVGLAFRRAFENRPDRIGIPVMYLIGITTHMAMLACQSLIQPWPAGLTVISRVWLPVMLVFPAATVLVGLLLGDEERRFLTEQELSESRSLLLRSQALGNVGSWELDLVNNRLTWSDEVYRIFGLDLRKHVGSYESFLECVHPDDRRAVDAAYTRSVEQGRDGYEIEHRIVRPATGEIRVVLEKCGHYKDTTGRIVRSVGFVQDITERVQAVEAVRKSEGELRLYNQIAEIFLAASDEKMGGEVLRLVLDALESQFGIFGYLDENENWVCPSLSGDWWERCRVPDKDVLFPKDTWAGIWGRAMLEKKALYSNKPFKAPEGHVPITRVLDVPILHAGKLIGNIIVANKKTDYLEEDKELLESIANYIAPILNARLQRDRERRAKVEIEEQLRQSRKLESVGRLAGGLAHDFNNILSVILGFGENILNQLHHGDPLRGDVKEIVDAGKRAATLTRQLLAFSRRQPLQPEPLDLNGVVRNVEKMLRRLIGEDIDLELSLADGIGRVMADPGQIEQVVMNLAINARDAMPQGGRLTIETAMVELDEAYAGNHANVEPGRYVLLAVTDTGCGMDKETASQVFEPFFTTKETGKGTGLGLSTVYGIVKQSGGNIWVYSEPGQGTTFKVYLPFTDEIQEPAEREIEAVPSARGGEHILVVEDEPSLLRLMGSILSRLGYRVTLAPNGAEALALVQEEGVAPDLVITDVVMPNMNGKELVETLRNKQPHLKALYMSGYTDNVIVHHGVLEADAFFIQKPFTLRDIVDKVQQVLLGRAEKPRER